MVACKIVYVVCSGSVYKISLNHQAGPLSRPEAMGNIIGVHGVLSLIGLTRRRTAPRHSNASTTTIDQRDNISDQGSPIASEITSPSIDKFFDPDAETNIKSIIMALGRLKYAGLPDIVFSTFRSVPRPVDTDPLRTIRHPKSTRHPN